LDAGGGQADEEWHDDNANDEEESNHWFGL
jgi:hypothetical protein